MRKLILTINITSDGFCNRQDSVVEDDWMQFINDLTERMGAVMFGRVTYKLFDEYWPQGSHRQNGCMSLLALFYLCCNFSPRFHYSKKNIYTINYGKALCGYKTVT